MQSVQQVCGDDVCLRGKLPMRASHQGLLVMPLLMLILCIETYLAMFASCS